MIREPRLLRRWYGHYQTRLIDLPILLAGGLLASIWIGDIWWQLFAALLHASLFAQDAFLGHDPADHQIFVSGKWNGCRANDVSYLQTGLFASYAIVVRYINRVGLGERDVFTCPLIEQRNHLTIPATP